MDDQTRDWLLEHHEKGYRTQAERTDKIRDRISFLVTPFTLLGGGIVYVWANYQHGWNGGTSLLFYAPLLLATLAFAIALSMALYCLSWGFKYSSIPPARALQDDIEKISNYWAAVAPGASALNDVKTTMMERYCDAADFNFKVNVRRNNLVLRSIQIGVLSFILLLLTLPMFFKNRLPTQRSTPTIIIYRVHETNYERGNKRHFDRKCDPTRKRSCTRQQKHGKA